MTVRIGRRFVVTMRWERMAIPSRDLLPPPPGADDAELARWRGTPPWDMDYARWNALRLIHGGPQN